MENVKRFFNNPFTALLAIVFVCITIAVASTIKSCGKDAENVANKATDTGVQSIVSNNQIQGLQKQIEVLTSEVEQLQEQNIVLESKIIQLDSLRIANFADARNKSLHDSYSELSKRYTKQKAIR